MKVFVTFSILLSAVLFVEIEQATGNVVTRASGDNDNHCNTNVNITIPPCVCTGHEELVRENIALSNELEELKNSAETTSTDCIDISQSHILLDGVHWTRFWWYNPANSNGWPKEATDVLEVAYGTCKQNDSYCFGRLPLTLAEATSELLAVDSAGSIYRWKFNPNNPTAHAAWNAFYYHYDNQRVVHSDPWNPDVIKGPKPGATQDSFMYRTQNGVKSVLVDDDNCDCFSTLSMGHGMCGTGFSKTYGPINRFGVDLLYDSHCQTPDPQHGLGLYFKGTGIVTGNCPNGDKK